MRKIKIYSKSKVIFGVFFLILATITLIISIIDRVSLSEYWLVALLFSFGFGELASGLSKQEFEKYKIKKEDNENQFIELSSQKLSFQILRWTLFSIGTLLIGIGAYNNTYEVLAIGLGMSFSFSLSFLIELTCYIFYKKKHKF